MATTSAHRVVTLDIVRGVAVMGILAMNIVAFAMPQQAYLNPLAFGSESAADFASWAFSFVFIDGKMRGLFSFLFGASMLLVIQLAEAKGESARSVTFRRQLWLLLFGYLHFTLIWYGDILVGYALIGMLAWHFRECRPRTLVRWGIYLVLIQFAVFVATTAHTANLAEAVGGPNPSSSDLSAWAQMSGKVAVPSADKLAEEMGRFLGPWSGVVGHQLTQMTMPLIFSAVFGWETLAFMLFGMAALKSGFLTGEWSDSRYRKTALIGFGVAVPAYAILAALLFADEFSTVGIYAYAFALTVPFRPARILAFAALIILVTRRQGWLVDRIAAAGRAAFTNYLGTSILMTGLFYGWGLGWFGSLSRAELWLVVLPMWLLMLAWSKPWLDRFAYGPFEWLWRSLARWKTQPMRKRLPAGSAAAEA
jgi:uncharacterized protein